MPVASFGPERLVTLRQLYCWRKAREGAVRGLTPGRDPSHRVSGCRYIGKGGRGVTCRASERIAQRQGCRITAELGSRDQPGVGLLPIAEVTPSCAPSPASCQLQVEAHCGLTAGPSGCRAADEDRSCYGDTGQVISGVGGMVAASKEFVSSDQPPGTREWAAAYVCAPDLRSGPGHRRYADPG